MAFGGDPSNQPINAGGIKAANERRLEEAREERLVGSAYPKALKLLSAYTINPEEFSDLYDPRMIKRDMEYAQRKEAEFFGDTEQNPQKKLGKVFEGVFFDCVRTHKWLGENAEITKTSSYDDFTKGVDFIISFGKNIVSEHVGIDADVTFAGPEKVREKLERILSQIKRGELGEIKYFKIGSYRGELKNIPVVIVGMDRSHLLDLTEMWVNNEDESLDQHPMQRIFLRQALLQLELFESVAKKNGRTALAAIFAQNASLIRGVAREKAKSGIMLNKDLDDDGVLKTIQEFVKQHMA